MFVGRIGHAGVEAAPRAILRREDAHARGIALASGYVAVAVEAEGRTVLVSSHLMSEMALTATNLVVIGRGSLIADTTVQDFIDSNTDATVLVRSPDAGRLSGLLVGSGASVVTRDDGGLLVTRATPADIGEMAHSAGIAKCAGGVPARVVDVM